MAMDWKKRILHALFLLSCLGIYAQSTLNGSVVDVQGEPVIGAAVRIAGTTTGTVTDFDGQFALAAADNAKIEISYLGYLTVTMTGKELRAQNGKVVLKEDTQALEEVVVVGYGVQKNSVVTAAISKVPADRRCHYRFLRRAEEIGSDSGNQQGVGRGSGECHPDACG